MNIPQAVGIDIGLSGIALGVVLIWLRQISAGRRTQLTVEAHVDQSIFAGSRERQSLSMRLDQTGSICPRVLLPVDDDAVRHMLRESLQRDGFEVVAVATASEALGRIAAETFDASLSDLYQHRQRHAQHPATRSHASAQQSRGIRSLPDGSR
jgi:PleD family two-component response regulator